MQDKNKINSIIIASEPLTADTGTWIEVAEHKFIIAWRDHEKITMELKTIDV